MAGSKPADSPGKKLNDGSNSAINELVESVGSHASDSDKETLAELISFGDTWKAEGEKMEKAWWSDQKVLNSSSQGEIFYQRCAKFDQLKETRKEEEEETLKVLFSSELMQGYLLDKYIEEYLYKWILYYPNEMDEEVIEGNIKRVLGYVKVIEYLRTGNMEPGMKLNLLQNNIGPDGAKHLADAIKLVGLELGVVINLWRNNIGDEGVKYLAEAIMEVGLVPGVVIILAENMIGDIGAKAIAEVIKLVGLAPGVGINLSWNHIGDIGANYIIEAIKMTGLPSGAIIDLSENNLSPEMREQLLELNKTVEGEIQF